MEQLQDVHVSDRDALLVGLARPTVVELDLARAAPARAVGLVDVESDAAVLVLVLPLDEGMVHVLDRGAVEHRRGHVHAPTV